jgi:hypothetical protein
LLVVTVCGMLEFRIQVSAERFTVLSIKPRSVETVGNYE